MPSKREVRDRMNGISDTMKITKAMYLISSTKLRKARRELTETEPYFYALEQMIRRIIVHLPEGYHHPLLDLREDLPEESTRRAILCVTADKGLAGAYNHNLLKMAEERIRPDSNDILYIMGEMGRSYFEHRNIRIEDNFRYVVQDPNLSRARVIANLLLERYRRGEIDEVIILYTRMSGSMEMEPEVRQLLPLNYAVNIPAVPKGLQGIAPEEFLMLPTPDAVVENIVPNYMAGFIYSALVESFCAEQSSRMMAMDSANKSAEKLLQELKTQYNRARQEQITQEITEVAAGAKARASRKD